MTSFRTPLGKSWNTKNAVKIFFNVSSHESNFLLLGKPKYFRKYGVSFSSQLSRMFDTFCLMASVNSLDINGSLLRSCPSTFISL
ncbi:hypothetical protein O3G_MSEX001111 [Manduca sexta]|nr:hypothetical protein O3G_MSEX001111 [Manduca sexta]